MAAVLEKLREFDHMAILLQMPVSERLGILNVSASLYAGLRNANPKFLDMAQPELERRLSYALPLMRRLASNTPVLSFPVPSQRAA